MAITKMPIKIKSLRVLKLAASELGLSLKSSYNEKFKNRILQRAGVILAEQNANEQGFATKRIMKKNGDIHVVFLRKENNNA